MVKDEDTEEAEKLEFAPAGQALGYISLNQARVLAMRTATETPGAYGTTYADVPMTFQVVEAEETEDHYVITITYRPQGVFAGRPGREQFFIEKEGSIAHRQVLALPRRRRRVPFGPIAIGSAITVAVAALALGIALAGGTLGGGGPELTATPSPTIPATATPVPAAAAAPVPVPEVQPIGLSPRPAPTATTRSMRTPTSTPGPSLQNWPWWRPVPTPKPTSTDTALPTSFPIPVGSEVSVIVISTDLAVGANRVVFGLVDREGMPVRASEGEAQVRAAYIIPGHEAAEVRTSATAQFMGWPTGPQGVFVANLDLDTAGFWQLEVNISSEDRGLVEAVGVFQVKEKSDTPSIGDAAPASVTPILDDVEDITTITSSPVPDPGLYRLSVHQALEAGKPLVVVFATPAFCVTATCGPQVQVISQLMDRFQDQANFIHVEVFENPHLIEGGRPKGGFVPAVLEWNLPTEPWTFVLDRAGRVQAKFEAFATEEELEEALEGVLRPR